MVTLQTAIQDSGAIDITLEENEEGDADGGDTVEGKDDNRQGIYYVTQKNDQGTQTEILSRFTRPDVKVMSHLERHTCKSL